VLFHAAVCRALEAPHPRVHARCRSRLPDFPQGSRTWTARLHPDANGVVRPLTELWPGGEAPSYLEFGIKMVRLMGHRAVSGGLRMALERVARVAFALGEEEFKSKLRFG